MICLTCHLPVNRQLTSSRDRFLFQDQFFDEKRLRFWRSISALPAHESPASQEE
jgi:hypothetical protein